MTTKVTNPFGPKKVANPFDKDKIEEPQSNLNNQIINHNEKVIPPPKKGDKKEETKPITYSNTTNINHDKEREELLMKEYEIMKEYNSSEFVFKTTVKKLPGNVEILKESATVIGLNITPLSNAQEIPLIKYKEDEEIPRCTDCKAYINPFLQWHSGGDKWKCNMCKRDNLTLPFYYEKLDKSNQRQDKGFRPEISCGSYEFYATKSFLNIEKPFMKPSILLCFDVSLLGSHQGYLASCIEGIKEMIKECPYEENTKVGIITYDSSIHFYNLDKKNTQPQLYNVSENTVFLPLPQKFLLVDLVESKDIILSTLDQIQTSFNNTSIKYSTKMIEVIECAGMILGGSGGKVLIFHSSHAIRESPILKCKETLPQEELIYHPTDNKFFATKGQNFTEQSITVELFISSEQYTV